MLTGGTLRDVAAAARVQPSTVLRGAPPETRIPGQR